MNKKQTNELPQVIVLKGGENKGKTTVLRTLISKLLGFEEKDLESGTSGSEKPADVRICCEPMDDGDFILVATAGDSTGEMNENVTFMSRTDPWKVAVVASRERQKILEIIRKYDTDEFKYVEITRTAGESDATLVDRIYEMIYPSNS